MTTVIFDISMSLDGFMKAANATPEEPMGNGGEVLHTWAMGADERSVEVLERGIASARAVICGRRTYDDSLRWWGADGPTGPARLPVFVVTHQEPDPDTLVAGGVYRFVTDGIKSALDQAQQASEGRVVCIMGGAEIGQQYLQAGLIDEIQVHLVPVLFGSGTRMFDHLDDPHVRLDVVEVVDAPAATHLRYRVTHSP